MSDSGRQIGECEHGRAAHACVPCLHERIKNLENDIREKNRIVGIMYRRHWGITTRWEVDKGISFCVVEEAGWYSDPYMALHKSEEWWLVNKEKCESRYYDPDVYSYEDWL